MMWMQDDDDEAYAKMIMMMYVTAWYNCGCCMAHTAAMSHTWLYKYVRTCGCLAAVWHIRLLYRTHGCIRMCAPVAVWLLYGTYACYIAHMAV